MKLNRYFPVVANHEFKTPYYTQPDAPGVISLPLARSDNMAQDARTAAQVLEGIRQSGYLADFRDAEELTNRFAVWCMAHGAAPLAEHVLGKFADARQHFYGSKKGVEFLRGSARSQAEAVAIDNVLIELTGVMLDAADAMTVDAMTPTDEWKTAPWFTAQNGITGARLSMAARRGDLQKRGKGRKAEYHVPTAKRLWPTDFEGLES